MPASDVLSATDVLGFRALKSDLSYPDVYTVSRATVVADNRGGRITTWSTVEAGVCKLNTSGVSPQERVIAERLGWDAVYSVSLPNDTLLTPADRLVVNGRTMEVGGVTKGGAWGLAAIAVVQERG